MAGLRERRGQSGSGHSSRQKRGVLSLKRVRPDSKTMPWGALGGGGCAVEEDKVRRNSKDQWSLDQ